MLSRGAGGSKDVIQVDESKQLPTLDSVISLRNKEKQRRKGQKRESEYVEREEK